MGSGCLYVGCSCRNVRLITIAECKKETLDIRDFQIRAMFHVITEVEAHIFCYVTPLSLFEEFQIFRSSVVVSKRQQPTPKPIKYLKPFLCRVFGSKSLFYITQMDLIM